MREKLPFFALAAVSCVVTYCTQRGLGALVSLESLSLPMRVANAAVIYVRYIGQMFWPVGLTFFYPLPREFPMASVIGAGAVLVGLTAIVLWRARRAPWLVTGWFWYLGTLVPVIGLVRVGGQAMADRYTYVPLIGLFLMLCWSLPASMIKRRPVKAVTGAVIAGILAVCGMLSMAQVGYWKDADTLLRHALAVTRDNWVAQYNLAGYLRRLGRIQEAVGHYEEAVRIKPDFALAQNNLGSALAELGRVPDAIGHWEAALRLRPNYADAHFNLGVGLAQLGRVREAVKHWERALEIDPNSPDTHYNLGVALEQMGRVPEAIGHYEQAVRLRPNYAEARNRLARLRTFR